jgi:hypothetical protein
VLADEWISISQTYGINIKFKVQIKITMGPNFPPQQDKIMLTKTCSWSLSSSNLYQLDILSGLFPTGFLTKILCAFFISSSKIYLKIEKYSIKETPNIMVGWAPFLLYLLDVPGTNLSLQTGSLDRGFVVFLSHFR